MKKIIILANILLITTFALSQTENGKIFIGGTTDLNFQSFTTRFKTDDPKTTSPASDKVTSLTFNPQVGYFLLNNTAFGIKGNLKYERSIQGGNDLKTKSFTAGPFIRKYINLKRFSPFIDGSIVYGYEQFNSSLSNGAAYFEESSLYQAKVNAGIAFFLCDRFSFDFMLGYTYTVSQKINDNPYNQRNETNSLGLKLGFVLFL